MRSLLVTGSDTGVGKTHVVGRIAAAFAAAGTPVQIVKVIETGASPGTPGDAATAASDKAQPITLFSFRTPIAPPAAAALEGQVISFEEVLAACRSLSYSPVRIYEGAGGIATPIDAESHDWADFAVALGIPEIIIVVPDRLGAINQSRLCFARAAACGLNASIWLNTFGEVPSDVARSTREALAVLGIPLSAEPSLLAAQPLAESTAPNNLTPLSTLFARVDSALVERDRRHRRRSIVVSDPGAGTLNLADNDYLELAHDPVVVAAAAAAAARFGTSASASPLITGWKPPHEELTQALCGWLGFPFGLLWTSGYAANGAVLGTLPQKGDLILADRLIHASMIAGLTRSGARFKRYPHLDLDRLEAELRAVPDDVGAVFVVTETVFSMDGDYPDLPRLARLRREHGFVLIIDEAHGLGWYGSRGAGLVAEAGIAEDVDVLVGTLGKTLGSGGAFTLFRDARLRDYLVNHAGEFIYSTGLPPPSAAAALAAIGRVRKLASGQRAWREQSVRFRAQLRDAGWNPPEGDSPIVPVPLDDEAAALAAAQALREQGILAGAVRPPTVPAGTSRLRFSLKRSFDAAAAQRVVDALRPAQRRRQRFAWVLGWAVPTDWFAGLVREAFPEGEHHFIAANAGFRAELDQLGGCDVIAGYSLGSFLLIGAADAGWAPSPSVRTIALLAPIWRFPDRAGLRALRRQLKSDSAAALATFYSNVGLQDAAGFTPPSVADLTWGLDELEKPGFDPRLPAKWHAIVGSGDRLLEAARLKESVPELQVVTGDHHPRPLLQALKNTLSHAQRPN